MISELIMDAIGGIDEKYIIRYESAESIVKKRWRRYILPIAACLAIVILILPGSINHNSSDREYEARHRWFNSISEAEQEFGEKFLFSRLTEYDEAKTKIQVGYIDKESVDNASLWTDMDIMIGDYNDEEIITMMIFSSLYKGNYPNRLRDNVKTLQIGNTDVTYEIYEIGSGFDDKNALVAYFCYEDCQYEFIYRSEAYPDKAFKLLDLMLAE